MMTERCKQCRACMPCPAGIDIPKLFLLYGKAETEGMDAAGKCYREEERKADACIRCGRCEKLCPQQIGISAVMFEIQEAFEEVL